MKICKLARNDFLFHKSLKSFIIIAIAALFISILFEKGYSLMYEDGFLSGRGTVGEFYMNFFTCDVEQKIDGNTKPNLGIYWLLGMLALFAVNVKYSNDDFSYFGYQLIARSSKRTTWWAAKCLSVALNSTLQLFSLYAVIAVYALIKGYEPSLMLSAGYVESYFVESSIDAIKKLNGLDMVWFLIILPLSAMISLNFIQCFCGLFARAEIGFLINMAMLVAINYSMSPLLAPSCLLPSRFAPFLTSGVNSLHSFLANLTYIAVVVILGYIKISRYDFIHLTGNGGRNEN